ncbi:MAG TPA: FHA domain-containing protein, partial [Candidatus Dormibacteraeota bacterium]|nr:FHA domain-containing protein [Candidatus Dormibacteraeota bacterium]
SAAAPPAEPPIPPSTDADLAAGARAAQQAAPEPPAVEPVSPEPAPVPWTPPAAAMPDVAATMVAPPPLNGGGAEREPTTLMPAWQPPAATTPPIPETMAMPVRPSTAASGAGPQAELTIESGPDAGHSHRAGDHALRMGRSPDNDVILRDPATSGHHARLERRGEAFWVVDLGSTNGTFVNGESVQEKQLNHGDRLTVGQNSLHFAVIGA